LVGERARPLLGEAEAKLWQRRREQVEDGRVAPDAAGSRHHRIVHLTEELLAPIRERYGDPVRLTWEGEISEREWALATYNPERVHDVTLFITNGDRLGHARGAGRAGPRAPARDRPCLLALPRCVARRGY